METTLHELVTTGGEGAILKATLKDCQKKLKSIVDVLKILGCLKFNEKIRKMQVVRLKFLPLVQIGLSTQT